VRKGSQTGNWQVARSACCIAKVWRQVRNDFPVVSGGVHGLVRGAFLLTTRTCFSQADCVIRQLQGEQIRACMMAFEEGAVSRLTTSGALFSFCVSAASTLIYVICDG
jgi:hypothetical protein